MRSACMMVCLFALTLAVAARADQDGRCPRLTADILTQTRAPASVLPVSDLSAVPRVRDTLRLSPDDYESLRATFAKAYGREALLGDLRQRLENTCEAEKLMAVLEWHRGWTARHVMALEEAAQSPEAAPAMQRFAADLRANPPPEWRIALARRLDEVTGSTVLAYAAFVQPWLAVGKIADAASLETLHADPNKDRSAVQNRVLVRLLYTYRELAQSELETFVAWNESDLGRWWNRMLQGAALGSYDDAAARYAGLAEADLARLRSRAARPAASEAAPVPTSTENPGTSPEPAVPVSPLEPDEPVLPAEHAP
ncbi:MAG TPA: hypothetical protein VKM54_11960 [Myxococcota bacterium]|nr:hypothetical protein [Myxococcota bacterium]